MANTFFRKPIIGADDNTWALYNDQFILTAIGSCRSFLYDDSGTLKISIGKIGIDNGSIKGISDIDTITTIDFSGVPTSNWAKIEMSVSGTGVSFSASDIAGKTDPAIIPVEFTSSWDGSKEGFYISADKRCVGLIYKSSVPDLACIINVKDNQKGYIGTVNPAVLSGDVVMRKFEMTQGKIVDSGSINGTGLTQNTIFDAIAPAIPNIGDTCLISGFSFNNTFGVHYSYSDAKRTASGTIVMTVLTVDLTTEVGNVGSVTITDGSATTFPSSTGSIETNLAWMV